MTLEQAIATEPMWLQMWMNILSITVLLAPLVLIISKNLRMAGIIALATNIVMIAVFLGFYQMVGYTKILGLPHIVFWTPLVIFLIFKVSRADTHWFYSLVGWWLVAMILISLAFDYSDAIRWLLGERAPLAVSPGDA